MTSHDLHTMNLNKLHQYVLTHREDMAAFQIYVDRSKSAGRMITISPDKTNWEEDLEQKIRDRQGQ
jgi:hypothetical protein